VATETTPGRGIRSARFVAAGTSLRIVIAPVVMALILADPGDQTDAPSLLAGLLFAVAAATDFLDGWLARRWEITTTLGSFLDTTADKLLVSGVLIALVGADRASSWIAAIIVGRELIILGLRAAVAADGAIIQPSMWGKLKTTIQFVAILLAILRPGDPIAGEYVDEWVMLAAAAITIGSAIDYLARFSSAFGESR
jgi:CDP-diacylglycerol--glycerol-3-phosphate 3-phosphatidyltransferase